MQRHYLPQALARDGKNTIAHWSIRPATRLVIFVHGFGGDSVGTWPHFPRLLPRPDLTFDYLFYGYDGKFTQANSSALVFYKFLDEFLRAPATLVNQTIPTRARRARFTYDRVVIAAHSLGAFVARRAILHAHSIQARGTNIPWLPTIRLVLFAPAHNGAYAAELASAFIVDQPWYLGKLVGYFAKYRSPLLRDLMPDSPVLTSLHREMAQLAAADGIPAYVRAQRVLLADDERVVINAPFFDDEPPDSLPTDHFGVCKPNDAAHKALEYIWREL